MSRSTGGMTRKGSRMPITTTKLEALRAEFNEAQQEFDQLNARVAAGEKFTPAEIERVRELADRLKAMKEQFSWPQASGRGQDP